MRHVYVVNTVELVERRYLVEFDDEAVAEAVEVPVEEVTDDDRKEYASELVSCGEVTKFTEGNANIEDITRVEEQT